uniref:Fibronectin type-III domain-containing protein n=1 Tax=Amphimedon queenslandica TaxID=400682 RepID=A0A1X7UGY0_AMPQE
MDRLLVSRLMLLLLVCLLVLTNNGLCECPPSSGMLMCLVFISHYFTDIYLMHDGNCFTSGSYFWDNNINAVTEAISCVLPGTNLTTGQWVRVADPDDPVDCDNTNDDPFHCTSVTSPNATLNFYLALGLPAAREGWYKCCLPTICSDPNTNIIFANIFRFAEIESFTVADLPSDMTVYPQEYKLNCTKIGHYGYAISLNIGSTALASHTSCDDRYSPCPGTELVRSSNTVRYTVNITWDGMTVSSGSISQSTTGDQMYQCRVADHPDANAIRIRTVTIKVPATAPSSLTVVNKTATTITVRWDSFDADGYVVNVTSDTDTVQTVQVEGSSNNRLTIEELEVNTTYSITVRAYQQLLGPASTISVFIHCQQEGIYLEHNGNCYSNRSYFWDSSVNVVTEAISCVLPGTSLTTGQWVRVDDPDDDPVDCNNNSDNDPFRCTNVTSLATINLYLAQGLPAAQEGWYKCCLPTDCSDPNTNSIFANIFRFAEIESFTVADFPSDMTVYPQEYKLNCTKIGHYGYGISVNIGSTALASHTTCDDRYSLCPGTELVRSSYTIRYTVNITWDGMTVSSGSISQSTTGDQMYQCVLKVPDQPTRTRNISIKVPATAPSSLTVVNKTATTITVSWTALDSSDADGYVVNVTNDTDNVQTVQVEGSSNNTFRIERLEGGTTYNITVRAYQELLGPASSTISVFTHCQQEGIYLAHNENCYPNRSYFLDSSVNAVTEAISCVLPGASLTTGQWVRVADTDDNPVDCNSNSDNDPFRCTNVTSPDATLNLYLAQGLSADQEGWYKCCLPTDCSDPNTNITFANIFRFAEIESFTVADFPSDMTVYPQEYKLNCVKIGFYLYGIRMSINSIALVNYANCDDRLNNYCSGTALVSSTNTIRYTVAITWNGMTVSNGSISQPTTGDQMYQCVLDNPSSGNDRTRTLTIKVPATAPSSLTVVNKTTTTITVSWTALDLSDADGYVVNVTNDTDTVQTVQLEGSSNNTITLNGLRVLTTYSITVRAYQQLLGPASAISVQTSVINSINWALVSSITQLNSTRYRIDCITTTDIDPSTDVYWLVNGVMMSNSNYSSIDVLTYNNTLLVYPDPLGVSVNVTCIAMIGGVNYSLSVMLHAPSGPPNSVRIFILNATSIKVNWTTSSEANGYVIEYTTGGVTRDLVSTSEDEFLITDLSTMSTYTISVYSYIDLPSVNSTVTVLKFDVPSPVTSLSVSNVSTTSITVNWTIPSSENYVTYYTISYTPSCPQLSSVNETVSVAPHQSTTTYSYTLIGLYSGTNYTITVRAGNVLGASNSSIISAKTSLSSKNILLLV